MREPVRIGAVIARGGDKKNPGATGTRNGVGQSLRKISSAPTGINDVGAHALGIFDAFNGVGSSSRSIRAQELAREEFHLPGDSANTPAIVGNRPNRSGHVRAVPVVVADNSVSYNSVYSVDVIDITVPIVIDTIESTVAERVWIPLAGIFPQISS